MMWQWKPKSIQGLNSEARLDEENKVGVVGNGRWDDGVVVDEFGSGNDAIALSGRVEGVDKAPQGLAKQVYKQVKFK